ncbi:hypothetical protein E2C01_024584 [Portunus trituberculatus]|uniref:Uncharacterized protein n=1 Tax=Portunus trituberculatus TaxID=210409 RepID=A0A5B7ECR0_PORTR|nr:hypothetical protein [Portunus trituberculatus]
MLPTMPRNDRSRPHGRLLGAHCWEAARASLAGWGRVRVWCHPVLRSVSSWERRPLGSGFSRPWRPRLPGRPDHPGK